MDEKTTENPHGINGNGEVGREGSDVCSYDVKVVGEKDYLASIKNGTTNVVQIEVEGRTIYYEVIVYGTPKGQTMIMQGTALIVRADLVLKIKQALSARKSYVIDEKRKKVKLEAQKAGRKLVG